ncbi:MAG: hypothetical protein PHQ35_04405 [Phycisphaerae bacterium]|nr:hypothetical protein [Phycisphaerae bacterium]MDD5380239.1 hypothetical protein [Phycisphaerae bacterium]
MTYPMLAEIREEIVPDNIWTLDDKLEEILKRQISSLPSPSSSSEAECTYPIDKPSLRGFLDRLFARHFFQIQNAILQQDTFERLVSAVQRRNITIADIGCGPAVASTAVLNIVSKVCCKLNKNICVNIALNDICIEALAVGRKMLETYAKHLYGINRLNVLALDTPFPGSMVQLRRISRMLGPYDICFLPYVLDHVKEDYSYENICQQLELLAGLCKPTGFILNLQDKFRESFARRIGCLLKTSVNKLNLRQKVYDSTNSCDEYSYDYFRMAIFPNQKCYGVESRFCLQRHAFIPKLSQISRNGLTICS